MAVRWRLLACWLGVMMVFTRGKCSCPLALLVCPVTLSAALGLPGSPVVTLSGAKGLSRWAGGCFASLSMTRGSLGMTGLFSTGSRQMLSGSRGALRLPSPLRTARDYFSVMQVKPFVRPLRDLVSPLL